MLECLANLTISADGKYINCVSVHPSPGLRFTLTPTSPGSYVPGSYNVRGILEQRSTRNGGAMLIVTGTAVPAELSVKVGK